MQNKQTIIETQSMPLVLGVDLGGTQLRVAVLRGATLLSRVGMLTGENPTPERILPRIYPAIQKALDAAGTSIEQIAGIGIAAPGPLDSRTGVVYTPPNMPGWDLVPLRDIFAQRFKIPIFVENDANAAGLGEYMFGAGRGCNTMVYMTISTGIGGCVIIDGKIMEGANGTAAELGHMTIDWHGDRCNCGNIGCLEYMASGTAIARHAQEAIEAGKGIELLTFAQTLQHHSGGAPYQSTSPVQEQDFNTVELRLTDDKVSEWESPQKESSSQQQDEKALHVTARMVALAAEAGVPLARAIIETSGEALGVGFVNIIHCFNPEMIILGGGVTQMGSMLIDPAMRIVQERAMKYPRAAVRIQPAQLGANVGLVGAGALIYYHA